MDIARTVIRALRIDKWFRKHRLRLMGGAAGFVVLVLAVLLGSFWRGLGAVIFSVAAWFVYRGVDWLLHRIRVTTEAGIPLSPVRMAKELFAERAKFEEANNRWAIFTEAQLPKLNGMRPHLHRHKTTADGDVQAFVNLAGIGGNLDAIKRNIADGTLAGVMDCKEVSLRETVPNARGWLTFYNHPPLNRSVGLADLPVPRPGFVSFGIDEYGNAAEVEHGLSVLSIGETGSGKSKAMWNIFASILRSGVPTILEIIDPKGSELVVFKKLVGKKIGNILIGSYSKTLQQAETMLARFITEIGERNDALGDRQLITATEDMPARYVWADEMNRLWQLYAKPDSPMVTLVSEGRSSKDALMASVQVAKVANLGHIRDQIPINICMRTKTKENTKAALALEGDDVPPAHLIPRETPGVGFYVKADGSVRKFRTMHVTDKQLDDLAHGELPAGMATSAAVKYDGPPCFVYDAPLKGSNRRGYVGVAGADGTAHPVHTRRKQHRRGGRSDIRWCMEHERVENIWNVHIDDRRMEVYKCPSRAAALMLEERLIRDPRSVQDPRAAKFTGRPVWNIHHNTDNPDSNEALARRAGFTTRVRDARREYWMAARESWALHQVKAGFRKHDRVERQVVKRDRFVERALEGSYR